MIFCPEENISQNHACTLNTITNIEQFIKNHSGQFSKTELWENLPKKIMYQSYKVVLDFLIYSNKIQILGRKVTWILKDENFDINSYSAQNHAPTLTTISNILEFISQNSGQFSKTELWENLPKKIMYQSYKVVLGYLTESNLIRIEKRKVIFGGDQK
jgi:hypothetical protein